MADKKEVDSQGVLLICCLIMTVALLMSHPLFSTFHSAVPSLLWSWVADNKPFLAITATGIAGGHVQLSETIAGRTTHESSTSTTGINRVRPTPDSLDE
jgi:hypothetical protein